MRSVAQTHTQGQINKTDYSQQTETLCAHFDILFLKCHIIIIITLI